MYRCALYIAVTIMQGDFKPYFDEFVDKVGSQLSTLPPLGKFETRRDEKGGKNLC